MSSVTIGGVGWQGPRPRSTKIALSETVVDSVDNNVQSMLAPQINGFHLEPPSLRRLRIVRPGWRVRD